LLWEKETSILITNSTI